MPQVRQRQHRQTPLHRRSCQLRAYKLAVGSCAGAAGFAGAAAGGLAAFGAPGFTVGGAPGGDACGGAGDCADEVSASASENRQAVSNVFIVETGIWLPARLRYEFPLSQTF